MVRPALVFTRQSFLILTVTYSLGGELPAGINLSTLLFRRLTVTGSTLRSRSPDYQSKLIANFKKEVFDHFTSPSLADGKPPLDVYIHAVRAAMIHVVGMTAHLARSLTGVPLGSSKTGP